MTCQCGCGYDTVDTELLDMLNQIRAAFGPVRITSGCRCPEHNAEVGGAPDSQHLRGRAADIVVHNTPPAIVADFAESLNPGGLGRYDGWVHIDSRSGHARWDYRSQS